MIYQALNMFNTISMMTTISSHTNNDDDDVVVKNDGIAKKITCNKFVESSKCGIITYAFVHVTMSVCKKEENLITIFYGKIYSKCHLFCNAWLNWKFIKSVFKVNV